MTERFDTSNRLTARRRHARRFAMTILANVRACGVAFKRFLKISVSHRFANALETGRIVGQVFNLPWPTGRLKTCPTKEPP